MAFWDTREGINFVEEVRFYLSEKKKNEPTLRDAFAMNALNGLISNGYFNSENPKVSAELAYKIADAMMEVHK